MSGTDPRAGDGDPTAGPHAALSAVRAPAESSQPDGATGAEAASARADAVAVALAQADPLVRIAGWFAGGVPGPSSESRELDLPASELGTTLLASAMPDDAEASRPARDRRRDTVIHADLGVPCALVVATALTHRLSDPVRKWWRRYHAAHATWPRPHGFGPGTATLGGEG